MSLGGITANPELFQNSANFVLYLVETLGVHAQNLANKVLPARPVFTIAHPSKKIGDTVASTNLFKNGPFPAGN